MFAIRFCRVFNFSTINLEYAKLLARSILDFKPSFINALILTRYIFIRRKIVTYAGMKYRSPVLS